MKIATFNINNINKGLAISSVGCAPPSPSSVFRSSTDSELPQTARWRKRAMACLARSEVVEWSRYPRSRSAVRSIGIAADQMCYPLIRTVVLKFGGPIALSIQNVSSGLLLSLHFLVQSVPNRHSHGTLRTKRFSRTSGPQLSNPALLEIPVGLPLERMNRMLRSSDKPIPLRLAHSPK